MLRNELATLFRRDVLKHLVIHLKCARGGVDERRFYRLVNLPLRYSYRDRVSRGFC